jgi:hypothetical protein
MRRDTDKTSRQADKQTSRQADKQTSRQADKQTRRQGDKETRRQGDREEPLGFPTNGGRAERVVSGCLERFGADIA